MTLEISAAIRDVFTNDAKTQQFVQRMDAAVTAFGNRRYSGSVFGDGPAPHAPTKRVPERATEDDRRRKLRRDQQELRSGHLMQ